MQAADNQLGQSKNPDEDDEDTAKPTGFFQSDFFQQITMTINTLIAIYSACMAALLSLFVPQLCCPDVSFQCFFQERINCYEIVIVNDFNFSGNFC